MMTALTVNVYNEQEERVLLAFLNSLNYDYEPTADAPIDETERILSNPAMVEKLERGRRAIAEGKGITITLDEIWK